MRITNMKPAPFAIIDDGSNFAVPALGVTMLVGYHLDDGSDHIVNSQNASDASGTLDFSTGTLTLNGSFRSGDATIGVNLTAVVANRPPGPTPVRTSASNAAVRPAHRWPSTGPTRRMRRRGPGSPPTTGTRTSTARPGRRSPRRRGDADDHARQEGAHTLTLVAVDGAGALGVDDVIVEVVDTTAPVLTIAIPNDCMWPPIHQFLKYELGSDVTVSAQDTCSGNLTAGVHIASVVSNQIEDRRKCPDPDDGRPDITSDGSAFCVRAERCPGRNEDRIYTVTIAATDGSGNTGTIAYPIVVPSNPLFPLDHDRNVVHPVVPVDLTGHERHCGFNPPPSFIFNGDPRCELGGAHTGPPTAHGDESGDVALALAEQTTETRQTSLALMESATTSRSGACNLGGGGAHASLGGTLAFALVAAFVSRARRRRSARR